MLEWAQSHRDSHLGMETDEMRGGEMVVSFSHSHAPLFKQVTQCGEHEVSGEAETFSISSSDVTQSTRGRARQNHLSFLLQMLHKVQVEGARQKLLSILGYSVILPDHSNLCLLVAASSALLRALRLLSLVPSARYDCMEEEKNRRRGDEAHTVHGGQRPTGGFRLPSLVSTRYPCHHSSDYMVLDPGMHDGGPGLLPNFPGKLCVALHMSGR